jgi:4a-hydroxytetrahydrobiopterin dehydratase
MALVDEHAHHIPKGTPALSEAEVTELKREIPGWIVHDKAIERSYGFPDFAQAMEFANKIAEIAQAEDHHPDLYVSYGKVRVELSTHKIGGLSRNDFIVAAKIQQIAG